MDGYANKDLDAKKMVEGVFDRILAAKQYDHTSINFSTMVPAGAFGENDKVLTPLYNYTKGDPKDVIDSFNKKFGPSSNFAVATGFARFLDC